jgi:hypothetical protein
MKIPDPGSGSGIWIQDEQPGSYFRELRNHFLGVKYLNSLLWIRDPGWKKIGSGIRDGKNSDPESEIRNEKNSDPGFGINIPDQQHCITPDPYI